MVTSARSSPNSRNNRFTSTLAASTADHQIAFRKSSIWSCSGAVSVDEGWSSDWLDATHATSSADTEINRSGNVIDILGCQVHRAASVINRPWGIVTSSRPMPPPRHPSDTPDSSFSVTSAGKNHLAI